jgi:hypothetical protein
MTAFSSPQSALRAIASRLGAPLPTSRFLYCRCPLHGDDRPSLSLWVKAGWLHAKCFAGCNETEVLAALGCDQTFTKPAPTDAEIEAEIAEARAAAEKAARALKLWEVAVPVVAEPGYLIYHYLTQVRGLAMPPSGVPEVLRDGGEIRHLSGAYWPAMVARVDDAYGEFSAVHRIWLDPNTGNKAPVEPPRAMLGPQMHGAVRLFEHPTSNELLVAEGIETALAAGELDHWQRSVWAAISTSGLMALNVPRRFTAVVIAADHDANGAGEHAANVLARRLRKKRVSERVIKPPEVGADWNDVLRAKKLGRAA